MVTRPWHAAPAERLAGLRILVGGFALVYLVVRIPHLVAVHDLAARPERFDPVGVLGWMDGPMPAGVHLAAIALAVMTGAAYVAGTRFAFTGPTFAVLLLVVTTQRNSWGQIFHTENLMVVHVAVLAVAPSARVWSVDARRHPTREAPKPSVDYGWAVWLLGAVTVATYAVAGWAKLRNGGLDWITGDVLRNQVAHDNIRKVVLGDVHSPVGVWLVPHAWFFSLAALASVVVELGAPLALVGRRVRAVWVIAAWGFHVGVLALMAVFFPYPLLGVAFASFFAIEEPMARVAVRWRDARRRRHRPDDPDRGRLLRRTVG